MKALFPLAALIVLAAGPALADPCTAVPDRGPTPEWLRSGRTFSGPVTYVGGGDSLCVAAVRGREHDRSTWVGVRVGDWYGPELSEPGRRGARGARRTRAMGRRPPRAARARRRVR